MAQMGPEALLMMSATARRTDLAEYTRLEYGPAEAPRIEATLLSDFEAMPSKGDAPRRFLSQALRVFRRARAGRPATGPTVQAQAVESVQASGARVQSLSRPSLAALPAIQAGHRRGGGASPLSAVPTMARALNRG
jgi:hypothetical protein